METYHNPAQEVNPSSFDKLRMLRVPNIVSMLSMVSQSNHEAWASQTYLVVK